jgi:hypothetical protein
VDSTERTNLALSAGAVVVSLAVATPSFAVSLATGAALESINFRGLRRSARLLFGGRVAGGGYSAMFGLRFGLLSIGVAASIAAGAHPIGLLLGLSLIVPAVLIDAWRNRPAVQPDAPALAADDPSWDRWDPWLARERAAEDVEDWP